MMRKKKGTSLSNFQGIKISFYVRMRIFCDRDCNLCNKTNSIFMHYAYILRMFNPMQNEFKETSCKNFKFTVYGYSMKGLLIFCVFVFIVWTIFFFKKIGVYLIQN